MKQRYETQSLKELIDQTKDGPEFDLGPIKDVLSEDEIPPMSHHTEGDRQVSRIRLIKSFAKKFGPNFKAYPKVKAALDHYDGEVNFHKVYHTSMGARYGR